MNRIASILLVLIVFVVLSCEQTGDFYLGMYQQPELSEESIHEGLNVFCVLRPDSIYGQNRSFAFVQQVWPALAYETFSILTDANVHIKELQDVQVVSDTEFELFPPDSIYSDTIYRPADVFQPKSGRIYQMTCSHANFPDAIGTCTMPGVPEISSITINGTTISLTLAADNSTSLIDIYLVDGAEYGMIARTVPSHTRNTSLTVNSPVALSSGMLLMIFYYDTNLATYYANSNTSVNFNKYRLGFTTLQSGYGVFGALNYTVVEL